MRNSNLIKGTRCKNTYTYSSNNDVGVFKTARGKYVVKVKQGSRIVILGEPLDTKKEAIETFNNYSYEKKKT